MTTTQPAAHWSERWSGGHPVRADLGFDRVFADPHLAQRGFFVDAPHATLGPVRQIGSPMRFSRTPARLNAAGPVLGADTADVLRELGVDEDELAQLARDGVTVLA